MDKYAEELSGVPKGQKSIAEAIKELEVAKEAFTRSARIEGKILDQEEEISKIKAKIRLFENNSYVSLKNSEFRNLVESMVRNICDEFSHQLMIDLNKKVSEADYKKQIELKVSWPDFIALKKQVSTLKLKLDTCVDVDMPGYKAKMMSSISNAKAEEERHKELTDKISEANRRLDQYENSLREIQEKLNEDRRVIKQKEHFYHKEKIIKEISDSGSNLLFSKLSDIEASIGSIFDEATSSKTKFCYLEEMIKLIICELKSLTEDMSRIEKLQKNQEVRFIQCLRNKDLQNELKKDKIVIEKIPHDEIAKIRKEVKERSTRIVMVENTVKHLTTEIEFLKKTLGAKLKGFAEQFETLEREKRNQSSEVSNLKHGLSLFESTLTEGLSKVSGELSCRRRFGLTSLEDRKFKTSSDSTKRLTAEDFSTSVTPVYAKRSISKMSERPLFQLSPKARYKYFN